MTENTYSIKDDTKHIWYEIYAIYAELLLQKKKEKACK
jgi:hypothetical protein